MAFKRVGFAADAAKKQIEAIGPVVHQITLRVRAIIARFDENGVTIAGIPIKIPTDKEAAQVSEMPLAAIMGTIMGLFAKGKGDKPEASE